MASTYDWIGNAHAVKQISTITVANTWAAGDTATITINDKDLVITCGSTTTTTATVASAISEAWNAGSRLDGTSSSSNATSNFGGQEFGEFREMVASVSGSVVTLVATKAGVPITIAVTESTAGTGTATGATATTATGPNHWDNGDNWRKQSDGTTATVPTNDDTVVFRDGNVPCKYGLPNNSKEVTIQVWKSYEGEVGLPAVNRDNGTGYEYSEYRQRYVRLDDAGTGTNIAHRFGLGTSGNGCTLFNLHHKTLKCTPVVYATGTPRIDRPGSKALNICCEANTSQLNILGGSVDYSSQDGGTSAFLGVYQNGGDSRGYNALDTTNGGFAMRGGTAVYGGSGNVLYLKSYGGTLLAENITGTVTSLVTYGTGIIRYASTGTVTNLWSHGGKIDCSDDAGAFTATNSEVRDNGFLLDPFHRITFTNPLQVYFELGEHIVLGLHAENPVDISFS